jgi:hypothetical protein
MPSTESHSDLKRWDVFPRRVIVTPPSPSPSSRPPPPVQVVHPSDEAVVEHLRVRFTIEPELVMLREDVEKLDVVHQALQGNTEQFCLRLHEMEAIDRQMSAQLARRKELLAQLTGFNDSLEKSTSIVSQDPFSQPLII